MAKAGQIDLGYRPHPKQAELHRSVATEPFYGGAAGGAKSHALRFEGYDWCLRVSGMQVYLFRRTMPELEKTHILRCLTEIPPEIGHYRDSKHRFEFNNGSMLHFCYCDREKDVFRYQGAEIHVLLMDEVTTFTEFQYDYLRGRVRCALPIPDNYRKLLPRIVTAGNPGGIGHEFVKRRWVDFCGRDGGIRQAPDSEGGMLRQFIPSRLSDNPTLLLNDPGYIKRLDALPEPYRTAYKDGDFDIFLGQAFEFDKRVGAGYVIEGQPVPDTAPLYMTYDWGFGKPFSIGWWWVDSEGNVCRFSEWYGWNGTPDTGLRLTDDDVAVGVREREIELGIWGRQIMRLCDPTCFNKKPDLKGGGQGPSTAEIFANHGIFLAPGDPSRALKIRQFRQFLKRDGRGPKMFIYRCCEAFIRTIPLLQTDTHNVEDIDTKMEDHVYDDACHICMARPISMSAPIENADDPQLPSELQEFYAIDRGEIDDGPAVLDDVAGY